MTLEDITMSGSYATFQEPTIEFDGFKFGILMSANLPYIHMAYHARRGDKVAAELLDKFKVIIWSTGYGGKYWPMEAEPDAVVEGS